MTTPRGLACIFALVLAAAGVGYLAYPAPRLTAANLGKARPGMDAETLAALLGPPRDVSALWDEGRLSGLRRGLGAALDLPGRKLAALIVERPVTLLAWSSGDDEALAYLEAGSLRAIAWRVKGDTQSRAAGE